MTAGGGKLLMAIVSTHTKHRRRHHQPSTIDVRTIINYNWKTANESVIRMRYGFQEHYYIGLQSVSCYRFESNQVITSKEKNCRCLKI